ncbi:MAG: DsbA family oxidoreductase [Bdellovibrionales bacterium]|nr:DsbA family oxidoreductase [Bdellovibrionales bacterium]
MHNLTGTEKQVIQIEVWSDIVCPWCWIGKRRLEKALDKSGNADRFEVRHRAFRLAPNEKTEPIASALARKYGRNPDEMFDHVEAIAAKEGLEYHLRGTLYGDTLDAHRLVLWSKSHGKQKDLIEAFSKAYFTDGKSLFDHATLLELVQGTGLNRNEAAEVLAGKSFLDEVKKDEAEARSIGANGVPFFVIAGRLGISGAQPPAIFLRAIDEALK